MNRIISIAFAAAFAAAVGCSGSEGGGCGAPEETSSTPAQPDIRCGEGTTLRSGQCVANNPAQTRQ